MSDQDFPNPPSEGGAPPPPPPTGGGFAASASALPWEDRGSHGFVGAFVETAKMLATSPQEAYGRMKEKGDFASPLLWVVIIAVVVGLLQYLVGLAFSGGDPLAGLPDDLREQLGPMASMATSGGAGIASVIFAPIGAIIGLFIWAGIVHLCLMALSALGNSQAGYEGTLRAVGYAYLGNVVSFIPVVGALIGLAWMIFLSVVGVSTLHKTTQGKALIALIIPIVLCCACLIFGGIALVGSLAGVAANAQ